MVSQEKFGAIRSCRNRNDNVMTNFTTAKYAIRIPLQPGGKAIERTTNMEIEHFFVAGINYKKTDANIRGDFAVDPGQYATILEKAAALGLEQLFVLSTCNRTEIYGLAPDAATLIDLLCSETTGDAATFRKLSYIRQGPEAIRHIFSVASGIDSQILGDYEIVGQLKLAMKFAKEKGFTGGFMERLFNTVLQSSKQVKNETALSGGTISVSFAAIQFLKEKLTDTTDKKIVLLGTGKIGRNTCKNMIDYLGTRNITLINRTEEKAIALAAELGLAAAPYNDLQKEVDAADIVIVATHANTPVISKQSLVHGSEKILIDLSIPNNIEPAAGELSHITLVNVDDLSRINDKTLQTRRSEVPKALAIIATHIDEFMEWLGLRSHVPVLKAVKQKLNDMHSCELYMSCYAGTRLIDKEAIQKVVNTVAVKMRRQHQPGCYYIEAINDFMTTN
ncbi:MAG: hemA [Sediminibacterium sp.]|nr:hemA [Sediminibacterium sp.]